MFYKERLKELREEKELKQKDIAKEINVHKDVYGQYEREFTIIPSKHLNTVCNFFDVSIDFVFCFSNNKNYKNFKKEIDKKVVGQRLKEIRKENNLLQIDLANILHTSQSVIADYERGRYLISTPFLYTICKKYKISADYLLGRIDDKIILNEEVK